MAEDKSDKKVKPEGSQAVQQAKKGGKGKGKGKKLGRDKAKCQAYRLSGQKDRRNFLSALKSCGIPFAEKMAKDKGLPQAFVMKEIQKRQLKLKKES